MFSATSAYLLLALTRQTALRTADRGREVTVEQYVADILHLSIEPETLGDLGQDADFRAAYCFPDDVVDG